MRKPNSRDLRVAKFEEDILHAKNLPQSTRQERVLKAKLIKAVYKLKNPNDKYNIRRYDERLRSDYQLADYIKNLT